MPRYYVVENVTPSRLLSGYFPEHETKELDMYQDMRAATAELSKPGEREKLYGKDFGPAHERIRMPSVKVLMTIEPKTPEKEAELTQNTRMYLGVTPVTRGTLKDCKLIDCVYYIGPDLLHRDGIIVPETVKDGISSHKSPQSVFVRQSSLKDLQAAIERTPYERLRDVKIFTREEEQAVYDAFSPAGFVCDVASSNSDAYLQQYLRKLTNHAPIDVVMQIPKIVDMFEHHLAKQSSKLPEGVRCARAMEATALECIGSAYIQERSESLSIFHDILSQSRYDESREWEAAWDEAQEELDTYRSDKEYTQDIDELEDEEI